MAFIHVAGRFTVYVHCAEVDEPLHAVSLRGLEELPHLQRGVRISADGAMHDGRGACARGIHLRWIGEIAGHDFDREPPDASGARPTPDARPNLRRAQAVEHLDHASADKPAGARDENARFTSHSGSARGRPATAC